MYLIRLFISFKGRARRLEMWLGTIGLFLASTVLVVVNQFASGLPVDELIQSRNATEYGFLFPEAVPWWTNAVSSALFLASFFALLALQAKRLHDRNWSAWWLVFFYGAPLTLNRLTDRILDAAEAFQARGSEDWANLLAYLSLALLLVLLSIALWFFIEFFFFRGTRGPNRFGRDPLGAPTPPDASL